MKIEPLKDGRVRCTVSVRYKNRTAKSQATVSPDQIKEIELVLKEDALNKISWGNRPIETTTDLLDWIYMDYVDSLPGRGNLKIAVFKERSFPEFENIPLNDITQIKIVLNSIAHRTPAAYNAFIKIIHSALRRIHWRE